MSEYSELSAFSPTEPVCFISTHLDDVALSCSHFLAAHPGTTVITVFAGAPEEYRVRGWNSETTGQRYAPHALQTRKKEDAAAMRVLGAHTRWLDLWEGEYVRTQSEQAIIEQLQAELIQAEAASVVSPLGLRHSDHRAVSAACLRLANDSVLEWYVYLDMPYAQSFPDAVTTRLAEVAGTATLVELEPFGATSGVKRDALRLYKSQLKWMRREHSGFGASMLDPERYWRVTP